jgi:site-specific recombinase XerC
MDIEEALSRYLTQLRADGRSPHTAGQYRRHVGLLAAWLRGNGRSDAFEAIDHETPVQFLSSPSARTRPDGKTKKATTADALRTSLRHRSIASTCVYAKCDETRLRDVLAS